MVEKLFEGIEEEDKKVKEKKTEEKPKAKSKAKARKKAVPEVSPYEAAARKIMEKLTPDVVLQMEEISSLNGIPLWGVIVSAVIRAYQQGALTAIIATDEGISFDGSSVDPKTVVCEDCGKEFPLKVFGQKKCKECVLKEYRANIRRSHAEGFASAAASGTPAGVMEE
jgi:hypothetical protein